VLGSLCFYVFGRNLRALKGTWVFVYAYGTDLLNQQCHIYKIYRDTGTRTDFCAAFQFTSVVPMHSDKRWITPPINKQDRMSHSCRNKLVSLQAAVRH